MVLFLYYIVFFKLKSLFLKKSSISRLHMLLHQYIEMHNTNFIHTPV